MMEREETSPMAARTRKKSRPVPYVRKANRRRAPSDAGTWVADLRDTLGLNRRMFSRLTGYSERAIAAWEGGKQMSEASRQRMTEVERLQHALARVMAAEFIVEWLQKPNAAFEGLKPIEVVERGEIDRIWRMIYEIESGTPG
jgi:DNA-binding transcriptional regulator YiaG